MMSVFGRGNINWNIPSEFVPFSTLSLMFCLFLVIEQARETIVVRHTDAGYVYAVFNADVDATSVTGHSDRSEMEQD